MTAKSRRNAAANAASNRSGPLTGLRVIEIGQMLAGPFVGSRLADFGAEVIKVEAPGRPDPMRAWGEKKFNGRGLWWPVLSRNKKLVTADLRKPDGAGLIKRLAEHADVLVENFRPGVLEGWGLGPIDLHGLNPGLVIARISGYGQTGPYAGRPGFASAGEAMGGLRYLNGYPGEPPPRMEISLGDSLTSMFATQGILMALYWRDALGGGKGQVIDASIIESCFAFLEGTLPDYDKLGVVRQPSGTGLAGIVPSNIYKSRDGLWVVIAANVDPMYQRLCEAIDRPDLAAYETHQLRAEHADAIELGITDWAAGKTAAEIDRILNAHNVVCGPIYTIADIVKDPQVQARGMVERMDDPIFGELAVPAVMPKLNETPGGTDWLGPPEMGAHNRDVYCGILGLGEDEFAALAREGII